MTDDAELMAAVVRALPFSGTQVEYARAALDALRPLLTEDVRREVGAEAVNVLRLKDQRIAELIAEQDKYDAMWRGAHEQYRRELREQMAALRDSLYREAAATWNLDDAATLGSRADGVDQAMDLIEGGNA